MLTALCTLALLGCGGSAPAAAPDTLPGDTLVPAVAPDHTPRWFRDPGQSAECRSVMTDTCVRGVVKVEFTPASTRAQRQAAVSRLRATVVGGNGISYYLRVQGDDPLVAMRDAITTLRTLPQVRYAGAISTAPLSFEPVTGVLPLGLHVVATLRDTSGTPLQPQFVSLTRARDGTLYLTAGRQGVLAFAPGAAQGTRLHTGDGQPAQAGLLSWMGDTLAVSQWRTWVLFAPDGRNVGCRFFRSAGNEFATQVFATHPLPGGLVLGEVRPPYPGQDIGRNVVVSQDQQVLRTLVRRAPQPERFDVPFPWGGGSWRMMPPYRTDDLWAAPDNGMGVLVVRQSEPERGGPAPVQVHWISLAGDTVWRAAVPVDAVALTEPWKEERIARWVADDSARSTILRDQDAARRAFRDRVPFPAYLPPVQDAVAGTDRSAWLRLSRPDDEQVWVRLNPAGTETARLRLSPDFHPQHADAAGLWGTRRVPRGIQVLLAGHTVPRYPAELTAPGSGPPVPRLGWNCERAGE